jgi:hypothetical protein
VTGYKPLPTRLRARLVRTTADRMAAHRKLDRHRDDLYGLGRGAGVGRGRGIGVGLAVGEGVNVGVGVAVGVEVGVGVAVGVTVGVSVAVGVGVGVAQGVSMYCWLSLLGVPTPELPATA